MISLPTKVDFQTSKWLKTSVLLVLIVVILLGTGIAVIQDFGEGVDEWHNSFYGKLFLSLYTRETIFQPTDIDYYNGPFYFMVFTVTSRVFTFLNPSWLLVDGRHLTNWIVFLSGALALFDLGNQLFGKRVAWFSMAGYLTQPLLIGHGFINQKDTPLMVFFLVSLATGFRALKAMKAVDKNGGMSGTRTKFSALDQLNKDWGAIDPGIQRAGVIIFLSLPTLILVELWFEWITLPVIRTAVINAYEGNAFPALQYLFNQVATDAYKTPINLYLAKVDTAYLWIRPIASLLLLGLIALLVRRFFSKTYITKIKPQIIRWMPLIMAGIYLGFTISIRLAGLLAGALISLTLLQKLRWKALFPVFTYWVVAAIIVYITWPVLWGNPLDSLLARVLQTSDFSSHDVLFNGSLYPSGHLPWQYVPTLIGIQLTIPILGFFILGTAQLWLIVRDSEHSPFNYLLVWMWLLIPLLLAITGTIPVYNNFRHILFAIPALLLVAGLGAARLWHWLNSSWVRFLVPGLILLSGLIPAVKLHPYQYLYYNAFAGGVKGAENRFELDYWCTSMRAGMEYINSIAPSEAQVAVWGGYTTASPFKREDINLYRDWQVSTSPDYALGCNQAITSPKFFPQLMELAAVEIDRATLSIVKAAPN